MKKNEKDSTLAEVIKKVVSIGVGAAFMTEDAVKAVLTDLPLPKDIVTGLVANAKNAKSDFLTSMKEEVKNFLAKIDVTKVAEEIIENYDMEVQAKVSFKRKKNEGTSKKDKSLES